MPRSRNPVIGARGDLVTASRCGAVIPLRGVHVTRWWDRRIAERSGEPVAAWFRDHVARWHGDGNTRWRC